MVYGAGLRARTRAAMNGRKSDSSDSVQWGKGYLGYAVIVNKTFWDGLPEDVRQALERAMKEATAHERGIAQKINDDALAAVRKAGSTEVQVLTAAERKEWSQALDKVSREQEARIGPELIRAVRDASGIDTEQGASR